VQIIDYKHMTLLLQILHLSRAFGHKCWKNQKSQISDNFSSKYWIYVGDIYRGNHGQQCWRYR